MNLQAVLGIVRHLSYYLILICALESVVNKCLIEQYSRDDVLSTQSWSVAILLILDQF